MTEDTNQEDDSRGRAIADGGEVEDEDDEFDPMTFYLREGTQRKVGRWLQQLEINHDEVYDSRKAHQYEAIVQVAMEHEDEVVNKVKEMSSP